MKEQKPINPAIPAPVANCTPRAEVADASAVETGGCCGAAVGAAQSIDPTVETEYWRNTHAKTSHASAANGYEDFAPAYRYGWESFGRTAAAAARTFESVEVELERGWNQAKGNSRLAWDQAKQATREAWDRVKFAVTQDAKSPDS